MGWGELAGELVLEGLCGGHGKGDEFGGLWLLDGGGAGAGGRDLPSVGEPWVAGVLGGWAG